jgi:hypothetical protein
MPDVPPPSTADTQISNKTGLGIANTTSSFRDTRSLGEAFNLFTQYGDEFMDENPLVGEPGSFIMSRAGENDRATGAPQAASRAAPGATVNTPSGRVSTPQVKVDTPGRASDMSNSPPSSGENKGKRKKTRIAS